MPFLKSLTKGAGLLNLFKMFPETSKPLLELCEVVLRAPSPFTKAERELIASVRVGAEQVPVNFMNPLIDGVGIELDPTSLKAISRRMARTGYLPLIELMRL
jgi:hypothetical protein